MNAPHLNDTELVVSITIRHAQGSSSYGNRLELRGAITIPHLDSRAVAALVQRFDALFQEVRAQHEKRSEERG